MTVTIRQPEPEEVGYLAYLWVELANSQRKHGSHLLGQENREAIQNEMSMSTATGGVLLAEVTAEGGDDADDADDADDGIIVGFVTYGPEFSAYEQDVDRGMLHNIYVLPEYRNQGIGSELFEAAEQSLLDAGMDVLVLEAMAANEDAQRLYRQHGYELHRVELERHIETNNHTKGNE